MGRADAALVRPVLARARELRAAERRARGRCRHHRRGGRVRIQGLRTAPRGRRRRIRVGIDGARWPRGGERRHGAAGLRRHRLQAEGFGVRGGGSFSRSKAKSTRRIVIVALLPPELGGGPLTGGIDREAKSEEITVQSDQWSEYADHLDFGTYRLDYMFGLRRARFARDSFTETGAGALSLEYDGGTLNLTDTDVKVHWWRRKGGVRPYVETFFRHSSGLDYRLPVEFADQEDSDFETAGLPMGQNAFAARAGVTIVRRIGSFTFEYRIRKATGQTSQAGDLRFRF